ncbi:hypothetical protein ACKKBF_B13910 [Auxenochlorella protothecoides x Auxenochlorella symbiontica]
MAGIGGLLDSLRADVSLGTRPAAGQEGDEETYITAVWDALCRHRLLETILNQLLDRSVPGACPDHERALRHKDAGNSFFKAGLYEDATKEYDECLHWLDARAWPVQAAQAYSNRALCWLRRGQATAAEEDAGQALTLDPANAKAAFRRSSARMALEDWPGALVDALAAQASAPGPDVEAAVARCRAAVGGVENMARDGAPACAERASGPDTDGSLRQAAASPAPSQPAVGGRQAQDPRLGRELVATRQVSRGECVLREAPAAWVLGRAASQERCARCGTLLGHPPRRAVHPCLACPLALFCSPACRTGHPFHQAGGRECGRAWSRLLPANSLLALRLVLTQRGLPAPQASALAGLACGTHLFSAEERLVAAAAACLAALCWAGAEGRSLRAEDEAPLLGLATAVFRASGQVRLNAFGLHPPWNSGRDTAYAQAVYPTASLANHACRPSISVYFDGLTLCMNAVAATSAGTPLWHCYGASAAAMSRPQRRAILEGTYGFRCACRDCVNGSEEEDAELTGLRCPFTPGCTGSVLVPTRLPARLTSAWEVPAGSGICSRCRKDGTDPAHRTSLERAVGALAGVARQVEALELHMAGLAERGAWNHPEVDEAVQSLREGLQVHWRCLPRRSLASVPLLKYLARFHLARGERGDGTAAVLCTLSTLRARFPRESSEGAAATAEAAAALEAVRGATGAGPTSPALRRHAYLEGTGLGGRAAEALLHELEDARRLPDATSELAVWFGEGGAGALLDHIRALVGLSPHARATSRAGDFV